MNDNLLHKTKDALAECIRPAENFAAAAENLLNALGYESDRKHVGGNDSVRDFVRDFPAPQAETKTESEFVRAAKSARIIFQYTGEEISKSQNMFGATFNEGDIESFLFVAVELKSGDYARGKYAEFAREINKRFGMPTVVLFRAADGADKLSLAFVGRRAHKTDSARDVLEKVSLLRNINCNKPHRGHLDILLQLSLQNRLEWMSRNSKEKNFAGLLAAWLDELNTDALNKRFYGELLSWFERANQKIRFPANLQNKREDWTIRLITRLLFVWFVKEKNLVAEDLFYKSQICPLLKNGANPTNDSYYRVVLQNLFFATLNTPIKDRKFSEGGRDAHRDFSRWRYAAEIANDKCKEKLKQLFAQTPFINGGLFDCLDGYDSPASAKNAGREGGEERTDYFSESYYKDSRVKDKLSVPDSLFFAENGLLSIFQKYKFTVEENTPIEQEVALDPELLGRVFENLLAFYNPETRENARKQTGSFYTPREVVDYMTRESVAECLAAKTGADGDKTRALLDYAAPMPEMDEAETKSLVRAISEIKIFDPAAGSGAFPMGVLHLLTLALSRLDSQNAEWHELQKNRAQKDAAETFHRADKSERGERLDEINEVFSRYSDSDFGRKLFLIQNSIFGADIQPVACQISKLRFFISLAIEQKRDANAENFGIKPLPNLETRFIAADSLIKIGGRGQGALKSEAAAKLERDLAANRERHFNATARKTKLHCKNKDEELRKKLAAELKKTSGFDNEDAGRIAVWNPYDQNAAAQWFDAEYMFGVADGFDIVIGNPPYVQLQRDGGRLANLYAPQNYESFARTGDLYMLFYERGLQLCASGGGLMFITSNSWLRANYGANLRGVLARHNPRLLINMGKDIFENVFVDANILFAQNVANRHELRASDINQTGDFPPSEWHSIAPKNKDGWAIVSASENTLRAKIEQAGTPIKNWDVRMFYGIKTGYHNAFAIDGAIKDRLCAENSTNAEFIKPTIRGKNIGRYCCESAGEWVIVIPQGWTNANKGADSAEHFFRERLPEICNHLNSFAKQGGKGKGLYERDDMGDYWWELRPCAYYSEFEREKLMWIQLVNDGRFALDVHKLYPLDSVFVMTGEDIQYLLAVLNSRLVNWQMRHLSPTSGMGVLQWKKIYVEKLPIPQIPKAEQRPLIELAQKITAAKAANPAADTHEWETEIDHRVYKLYNLTKKEIAIIEAE